jgi:hypothetical protein
MKNHPLLTLSKSIKTVCTLAALFVFIGAAGLAAENPVFDLGVSKDGKARDNSAFKRKLIINIKAIGAVPGEAAVRFRGMAAISILPDSDDPLFSTGACTWMVRCKFDSLEKVKSASGFASRWDGPDKRAIGFVIDPATRQVRLNISSTGKTDSIRSCVLTTAPVPADQWVTIAGRYAPGQEMAVQLFDASGALLGSKVLRTNRVAEKLFDADTRWRLGLAGMTFSRFRAWNTALSDAEIKAAATGQ